MAPKKKQSEQKNNLLSFIVKKKPSVQVNEITENNNIFDFVKKKNSVQVEKSQQIECVEENFDSPSVITDLENQLEAEKQKTSKLSNDLKTSVGLLKNVNSINMNKDIQIDRLNQKLKYLPSTETTELLFSNHEDIFDKPQLRQLRSIASGKSKDSTFVMAVMRFLYPDTKVLGNRSVTGKMRNKIKKKQMTPRKIEIVTDMLIQRINSEKGITAMSVSQRMDRVKKLMRDAITKLKKVCSKKPSGAPVLSDSFAHESQPKENALNPNDETAPSQQDHPPSTLKYGINLN